MEELTKRNGNGVLIREIDKIMKRFDTSVEWLEERIVLREEENDSLRRDSQIGEREMNEMLTAKKMKNIEEVVEEVEVLVDTNFFNKFSESKSSSFLKRIVANQSVIDIRLLKKAWKTLNCTPKTIKVIREIQENLLCIGKRKELITKKRTETKCWCSRTGLPHNAKHAISCCKKVSGEINSRDDIVVNILLNNILIQRGLISHEQKWEERKTARTRTDEISVGTEHARSDEWKAKGGVMPERS